MGLFRNIKRKKLRDTLLTEGKLEQYKTKFNLQLKRLDETLKNLKIEVKESFDKGHAYEAKLAVYQFMQVEKMKNNVLKLKTILDKSNLKLDHQKITQEFIDSLNQFKDSLKSNAGSKRKERRAVKTHGKEALKVEDQLSWIDKRIDKIDKKEDKKQNITDKSLDAINVEDFLNGHE